MMLIILKLIKLLDEHLIMGVCECGMLNDHHSGIDSNIINTLLLPERADMDIAYELEQYFCERNDYATDPAIIEDYIKKRSFSVKYAKKNQQMCQLRKQILELDEKNIENMETKHKNGRNRAEALRLEANGMDCFYKINYLGKRKHIKKRCRRCSLRTEADAIRFEQYEHLLPTEEYEQFGVVFEMRIPSEIALLRDMLYEFNRICVTDRSKLDIKGDWFKRREILQFSMRPSNRFVTFGSTKSGRRIQYHVDEPFESFIIPNSYNCTYHVNNFAVPTSLKDAVARKMLTFKVQNEYECLQWTVDGALHTQNQVLARQSECPQNQLSLSEFKNFGSLRADGSRLQLRKLYAMMETEALSFAKESVLLLIMQTLWECGVSGNGESIREPHMDFNEPKFCTAMIELLGNFFEKHRDNWMHPFKLLVAAVIAVRAFEINETESLAKEIVRRLLRKIRSIAVEWIDKINNVINGNQNMQGCDENQLRLKLMYAAIVGAITFCIQPEHDYFDYIVANDENGDNKTWITPQYWLHFIITLHVNAHLYENNDDRIAKLPLTLCVFKRIIEIGGIHLESTMRKLIEQNDGKVYEIVAKHWSNAKNERYRPSIYFHEEFKHLLLIDVPRVEDKFEISIEVDIIIGEFLINGLPLSRLPPEMTKNEMYKWFFGRASMAVQTNSQNHYSTVHNNIKYDFCNGNQGLIITERRSDDFVRETVSHEMFRDDFPNSLVWNYYHWWNKRDNCIEFQKNHLYVGHPNYSADTDIDYRLDLSTRHLIHVQTNRQMLDIGSDSFRKITNHLARLEHSIYIHVLLENPKVAIVELFRMKLKFKVDCSNPAKMSPSQGFKLQSFEFNGMCVSLNQKIGTLYGLNHGLVLESCQVGKSKPKILLIPHGSVQVQCVNESVSVDVDFFEKSIRNPPIYQYQVDECLKQLKASDSSYTAWFYLAYLHAITSHGQPEPLTGMSGTERALQILQSAFAWSSSPYEPEALNLLNDIAALSPCRKKINFHQIVEWPTYVPHHCAQDSFIFIVKKLIEDSQRLHGLHSTAPMQYFKVKTDLALNQRDYLRCLQLQPNLRISDEFIEHKTLKTSLPIVKPISLSKDAQMISILYHNQKFHIPAATNLKAFLTKGKELQGTRSEDCISHILSHIQYDKLVDSWIQLYDVARSREQLDREEFALVLSLFAHQNEEIAPILALQAVAQNPQAFESIQPPPVQTFRISCGIFDQTKVSTLLESYYPQSPYNFNSLRYGLGIQTVPYTDDETTTRNEIILSLMTKISRCWPCNAVNLAEMCTFEKINEQFRLSIYAINAELNSMLSTWYDNYRLNEFIEEVETRLESLAPSSINQLSFPQFHPLVEPKAKNWPKYAIDVDAMVRDRSEEFKDLICAAKSVWQMDEGSHESRVLSSNQWWAVIASMFMAEKTKHLSCAGLIERLEPSVFLPKLLNVDTNSDLKSLIGAWAIAIAREQYQKRVDLRSGHSDLAATRESENKPHTNWRPCEYPEWLLFEIEQNLTIRRIQIEIAKRMISPPSIDDCDTKHSVMQLNMGEGKTAVIVPILAAVLADGNQACQITVLKSLFARNLKFLRQYLGGLLDRRIYTFPCRRDMKIHQYVEQLLNLHEECKTRKGKIIFDHKGKKFWKSFEVLKKFQFRF